MGRDVKFGGSTRQSQITRARNILVLKPKSWVEGERVGNLSLFTLVFVDTNISMTDPKTKEKDLAQSDISALAKIRAFVWAHPEMLYKGVPIAMAGYACYPLLLSTWYILPWLWSGYAVYSMFPRGTLTYLWAGLKVYRHLT